MSKKQQLEGQKTELINDLMATVTISEELWSYHPDNPKKIDITVEYEKLQTIKKDIEVEIDEIEVEIKNLKGGINTYGDDDWATPINDSIDSTELDRQWANESDNLEI